MDEKTTNHITFESFKRGLLQELGHKPEELSPEEKDAIIREVEENWWFCGGQDTRSGLHSTYDHDDVGETQSINKEILLRWEALWNYYFPNYSMPEPTEICVCGKKHLRYNCYITDGNVETVIMTGRVCIQQFLPKLADNMNAKHCDDCMKPHKNRKDNYCNDCRLQRKEEEKREEQEREEKRQEEEKERLARICACGGRKEPEYPRCWNCHTKWRSSMTEMEKKKFICSCGKTKQPGFTKCFACHQASRARLAQFLARK